MLPASHSKVLLLGSLDTTKNVLSIFLNTILFYLLVLQCPLSCSFSINAHQDNKTIKDVVAKQCIGMYSLGYKMFKHSMHVLSCTQTKIVKNVTPPKAMNIYKKYLTNKPTSCSDPNSYNFCTDCRRFFVLLAVITRERFQQSLSILCAGQIFRDLQVEIELALVWHRKVSHQL